jgi:hypothetical protein
MKIIQELFDKDLVKKDNHKIRQSPCPPVLFPPCLVPTVLKDILYSGIIYLFYDEGRFFLAVPEEIKEAYRIFGNIHFDETLKRHQLVYKYISALNNLYGVFKIEKLIEIFNCQNDKKLTSKEFLAILDKHLLRQQSLYYHDGYIINDYFGDEDLPEAELLLKNTADMPYYIPGKNDISKYADDSYFEMTPQLTALKHYIVKNMCSNEEIVGYLVDDIDLICSMEEPMQDIIYEFERRNIFINIFCICVKSKEFNIPVSSLKQF